MATITARFSVGAPARLNIVALRQKATHWARKKAPRKYSASDRNKAPVDDYPEPPATPMFTILSASPNPPLPKRPLHSSWAPVYEKADKAEVAKQ